MHFTTSHLARGAAILCLLVASSADAQSIEGKLNLGLELDLLSHRSVTLSPEGSDQESSISNFNAGIGLPPSASPVLGAPGGLDIGYGVTDSIVLGVRAGAGVIEMGDADSALTEELTLTIISVTPHLDYVFNAGGTYRPYLSGLIGLGSTTTTIQSQDVSTTTFSAGAALGVHVFAAQSFSIDPQLHASYVSGSSDLGAQSADLSAFTVGLSVGLTGWL